MQRAMHGTVDEVIAVAEAEGIDADIRRVDNIIVATNAAQLERAKAEYEEARHWEVPEERLAFIDAAETGARIAIKKVLGAFVMRNVARVQPAKLVQGLAGQLNASVFRSTNRRPVLSIEKGKVTTDRGAMRAEKIIRATEGFTAGIPGHERLWLPLNSAIVVTEPLPESLWKEIGWAGYEVLGDAAHAYCYAQRTREGRIAMGGRGVPYRFGSRTDERAHPAGHHRQTARDPDQALAADAGLASRSRLVWHARRAARLVHDMRLRPRKRRRLGRRLCRARRVELQPFRPHPARPRARSRHRTDATALGQPHRGKWEPEPLRWLGVHSMYQLYRIADQREANGLARTSRLAALADRLTGH